MKLTGKTSNYWVNMKMLANTKIWHHSHASKSVPESDKQFVKQMPEINNSLQLSIINQN